MTDRKRTEPKKVTLCGIPYTVTVTEECVLFSNRFGGPCYARLTFFRKCGIWYTECESSSGAVPTCHILEAQAKLNEWYGGDHKFSRGEYCL